MAPRVYPTKGADRLSAHITIPVSEGDMARIAAVAARLGVLKVPMCRDLILKAVSREEKRT